MSSDLVVVPYEVPFNESNLLLIEYQNLPFVPLQPVLSAIGLSWKITSVQQSLKRFRKTLAKVRISYQGAAVALECISLRKLPVWLMAIELALLNAKVRKKLKEYQNGCDDALWDHWFWLREHAAPVTLTYEGHRFRFRYIGNECWYVAADVVAALGLRDTASVIAALPTHMCLLQQIGVRRLNTISQAGLERTYLTAPPQCTERLRGWLAGVTNDLQIQISPRIATEAFIRKECSKMSWDYLARTRAALRQAGVAPVEWDEALAQHLTENLPWLLIRNQRWLLSFSEAGVPQFSCLPGNAGVFTPEKLVSWVQDADGANRDILAKLLTAIGDRLASA